MWLFSPILLDFSSGGWEGGEIRASVSGASGAPGSSGWNANACTQKANIQNNPNGFNTLKKHKSWNFYNILRWIKLLRPSWLFCHRGAHWIIIPSGGKRWCIICRGLIHACNKWDDGGDTVQKQIWVKGFQKSILQYMRIYLNDPPPLKTSIASWPIPNPPFPLREASVTVNCWPVSMQEGTLRLLTGGTAPPHCEPPHWEAGVQVCRVCRVFEYAEGESHSLGLCCSVTRRPSSSYSWTNSPTF